MSELVTEGRSLFEVLEEIESKYEDGLKLEFGSGQEPRKGYKSVDFYAEADYKVDLFSYPWPFEDDSVDLIYSNHFVEHVPDWNAFWREVYRIMKDGGYVVSVGPYWTSVGCWQDPDHKQPLSEQRFGYLHRATRKGMRVDHYEADVNFVPIGYMYSFTEEFDPNNSGKSIEAILAAKKHYLNVVSDFCAVLKVDKGVDN